MSTHLPYQAVDIVGSHVFCEIHRTMKCYPECWVPILLLLVYICTVPGPDTSSLIPCWLKAVGLIVTSSGPLQMVAENSGARPVGQSC